MPLEAIEEEACGEMRNLLQASKSSGYYGSVVIEVTFENGEPTRYKSTRNRTRHRKELQAETLKR